MKLPAQYRTGFERCCDWLTRHDTNIAIYGAAFIAAFLLADFLAGGVFL